MNKEEARIAEAIRLLEETGEINRCVESYPDLGQELREFYETAEGLADFAPPSPLSETRISARRLMLSTLSQVPGGSPAWKRFISNKAAALAAAATLFVLGTVGAGAATGSPFTQPVNDVLDNLGISGDHGQAVSDGVNKAKMDAEANDKPIGSTVSEAACTEAHNKDTLPYGAQTAPGHNKDAEHLKDCTHPSNLDGGNANSGSGVWTEDTEEPTNHGNAVSNAVHDAKAKAQEDGEKAGPAVSEAVCTEAHNKDTLPDGAQIAPGHNKDPEQLKDCTHPSNALDGSQSDTGGHGKVSAPGQQKSR